MPEAQFFLVHYADLVTNLFIQDMQRKAFSASKYVEWRRVPFEVSLPLRINMNRAISADELRGVFRYLSDESPLREWTNLFSSRKRYRWGGEPVGERAASVLPTTDRIEWLHQAVMHVYGRLPPRAQAGEDEDDLSDDENAARNYVPAAGISGDTPARMARLRSARALRRRTKEDDESLLPEVLRQLAALQEQVRLLAQATSERTEAGTKGGSKGAAGSRGAAGSNWKAR
jgi:hypothetical protein